MNYTTKDYGILFLGVDQDVYYFQANKDTIHSPSYTMGRNQSKVYVGKGNPTSK